MATFSKGGFQFELDIAAVGKKADSEERQRAWVLYVGMVSRTPVCGTLDSEGQQTLDGEILYESLRSLEEFRSEARDLARLSALPPRDAESKVCLAYAITRLLTVVVQPFLDKWSARYQHWWREAPTDGDDPMAAQSHFRGLEELVRDWVPVREFCREVAEELETAFELDPMLGAVPKHVRADWLAGLRALGSGERSGAQ